jgi:hypothetical protein
MTSHQAIEMTAAACQLGGRMNKRAMAVGLILIAMVVSRVSTSQAEDVEHDRCSCKLAMKGAESTLKGGTCVRTESSICLMEWGGGSTSRVAQGNGWSQTEASAKVQAEFTRENGIKLDIPRLVPLPDNATPLQFAIANLSRIPPAAYGNPGVPESFVLAAGTAMVRFAKGPLNFLATDLLRAHRERFVAALQKEGEFEVEQFIIRGNTGCLQIEDPTQGVRVFVKTPFANSERC